MTPAYYFHTTILHLPNSPPSPTFFQQTLTPQQTNKQSINRSIDQSIATTHEPPTDRQPNNHKFFLLPMSRLTCFHPTSTTQIPPQISHRIPNPQPASRGSQNIPWTPTTMMKIANIPTTWVLKHIMQRGRTNSQEARRNSCHLHLHQVVMWGRIYATARGCVRRHRGTTKLHFLTHPFVVVTTTTTLKTLFAFCGGTPSSSPHKIRRMSWVPFYFTKEVFPKFVLINIPKVLSLYQKCKLVPLMFPKVLWVHFRVCVRGVCCA